MDDFFTELPLPPEVLNNLSLLDWQEPTPVQRLVIPPALEGYDILGAAPTGTGKSAAFLLPVMARLLDRRPRSEGVRALVLEPTRELALQLCKTAQQLGEGTALSACALIGGAGREEQRGTLGTIAAATPGRLLEFLHKGYIDPAPIEILIIDEADRMLDLGFREAVAEISRALSSRFQTMLFSATLEGPGIRDFAKAVLNEPFEARLGVQSGERLPEGLQLRAYCARDDRQKAALLQVLLKTSPGRSLVFVRKRERVKAVERVALSCGLNCATLSGDLEIAERTAALKRFAEDRAQVLVATDVAARGLDISDVSFVYNFDLPRDAAVFVHRCGRTARAGATGVAISLVLKEEQSVLARLERYTGQDIERRSIKGAGEPFDENPPAHSARGKEKNKSKSKSQEKKTKSTSDRAHVKVRKRDRLNKGKPDLAAKRARRQAARGAAEPGATD
ncbi:MAG: DEAD/DEAH box helicase [Succinivibrio sp.]|nr:DEAD/DEAH box helicase [Succinivibrio sp.]